jgi:tetratricopeptide (TPR) repeat protein
VWVAATILLVAGWYAYSNSFEGVLAYDDTEAIASNPHLKTLWPVTEAARAPKDTTLAGRPVAAYSFAISYALAPPETRDVWQPAHEGFARNIWGYHAFNIAVHLATGLLLFGVIRRTLQSTAMTGRFGDSAASIATASALIWVVHPLNTAAVTYLVQRVESLMSAFYLLTLYCAIRSWDAPASARWRWWCIGACALGMGTKETMVSAPLIVGMWFWVFEGRRPFLDTRIKTLLTALAATWVILAVLVASGARTGSVGQIGGWTVGSYLMTQAEIIVHYLSLAAFPGSLVFSYGWTPAESWFAVLPHVLSLAAALIAGMYGVARRHPLGFVTAAFFLILAPTSSLLPVATEVAAEHRMYLPLAAVISGVVTLAYGGLRRLIGRGTDQANRSDRLRLATAAVALVIAAVVPLSAATRSRNMDYSSLERLMLDAVRKRPGNARAQIGAGVELLTRGAAQDAERHFRRALESPQLSREPPAIRGAALVYLGASLGAQGRPSEAIGLFETALQVDPGLVEVHGMLGEANLGLGRDAEALRHLTKAAEVMPDVPPVLNRLALLLASSPDARLRNGARAVELARRSLAISGGRDPLTLDTLAAALAEAGQFTEAVQIQSVAIAQAVQGSNAALAEEFRSRLALYQRGLPFRAARPR